MSTKRTPPTPIELAERLIAEATEAAPIEPGNEALVTRNAHAPGALDAALMALMDNEATKAAGHLRRAIELCAQPVAVLPGHGRSAQAQDQRNSLLNIAAGALALLEQANYRGPDRRTGNDRRDGEDRRALGAEPAAEVIEQRCGEQRRSGGERRTRAGEALWEALQRGEDAHYVLAYKLAPLLAVCEAATKATQVLNQFAGIASHDKALQERLSSIEPEWQDAISDAATPMHIGQCLLLARGLCDEAAGTAVALIEGTADAMAELKKAGG